MRGALLVAGTASNAGKSVVVAGLCRWLRRQGVRAAPFKALNVSLHSAVTRDGREIGRAQALQAAAAGAEPEAAMSPVLLKPSGAGERQVVVLGRPAADPDALDGAALRRVAVDALADLRARYDVVVCEGSGAVAEPNLRAADVANLGLARAAGLPVVVVADVDRGGALAALHGSLALLEPADQALVAGVLVNRVRGDAAALAPALAALRERTGRPVLGMLPWLDGVGLDAEDALALPPPAPAPAGSPPPDAVLDVAVLDLRWTANATDLDPLAREPGVRVRFTRAAADVARADLVVVPGTKATIADLDALRADGLGAALRDRAAAGGPILAICGGYQLLGERIVDEVESRRGAVAGLGLLPVCTVFAPDKVLRRVAGTLALDGRPPAAGYEIRHGRPRRHGAAPLIADGTPAGEGCVAGAVLGTSWHGLLEGDEARRALLRWVAARRGLDWRASTASFAAARASLLDRLGDLVEHHADTAALAALIERGAPPGLPVLATALRHRRRRSWSAATAARISTPWTSSW